MTIGIFVILKKIYMRPLYDEIRRYAGKNGPCLVKHLATAGIKDWDDITKANLFSLRDVLRDSVSPNSVKTYLAQYRAFLARWDEELDMPKDWRKIFQSKSERPVKTFLTKKELLMLEAVPTENREEDIVKVQCLLEAFTGARISDILRLTAENISDGYLTYTSQKTATTATVPVSEKTRGWIAYAQENREAEPKSLMQRNRVIRRLLKRAGICAPTKIYKAGREMTGEKWKFISSHSFRVSAATNMAAAGLSLTEIRMTLGHTNELMTSRYIAASKPNLSAKALSYFGC